MSIRYFMQLAYNGSPYHGWQSQPNALGVQQVVEDALSTVLRRTTPIVGAGRTDTGVNARRMFAHFDAESELTDINRLIASLNSLTGRDIAIYTIRRVGSEAHARFDAVSRTYKYFITKRKSPFLYPLSWTPPYSLDIDEMNAAAACLMLYSDFTSFSKLHTDTKTNICRIDLAEWTDEGEQLVFTITADRFLRNMVRAIVGTLVDVGRHRLTQQKFCEIIEKKNRCEAGVSVPGNALFLWDVCYPYPVE